MSKLEEFLQLADVRDTRKVVKVKIGGKPYEFVVRPMTQSEQAEFQRRCLSIDGATKFDIGKYNSLVLDECIVEPNFKDAEFLRKAGCQTAADFRDRKIPTGVLTHLTDVIAELSGTASSFNEEVDEAKN